jgi:hypothetical protein
LVFAQPVLVFEERDFSVGSFQLSADGWANVGSATALPQGLGGNPGAWLSMQVNVQGGTPPLPYTASTTVGLFFLNSAVVSQASLGGISSIQVEMDSRLLQVSPANVGGCGCSGQAAIIRQNGMLYAATLPITSSQSIWVHMTSDQLRVTDFDRVLFQNPIIFDTNQHPDFSASGAPIELGIWRGNSNGPGAPFISYSVQTGLDNLRIAVTGRLSCDSLDFNNDTITPDSADLDDFLAVLSGGPTACSTFPTPGCKDLDFNNDGLVPDSGDLDAFLRRLGGGACAE